MSLCIANMSFREIGRAFKNAACLKASINCLQVRIELIQKITDFFKEAELVEEKPLHELISFLITSKNNIKSAYSLLNKLIVDDKARILIGDKLYVYLAKYGVLLRQTNSLLKIASTAPYVKDYLSGRREKLKQASICITRVSKGYLVREKMSRVKKSATIVQALARGHLDRKKISRLKRSGIIVQSLVRGYLARKNVVLPFQIKASFSASFPFATEELVWCICRGIFEIKEQDFPAVLIGDKSKGDVHYFPVYSKTNWVMKKTITNQWTYVISKQGGGVLVEFFLLTPKISGSYKQIEEIKSIGVRYLVENKKRKFFCKPHVIIRTKNSDSVVEAQKGVDMLKKVRGLLKCVDCIPVLPEDVFKTTNEKGEIVALSIEQEWYHGDLDDAFKLGYPLDIDKTAYKKLTLLEAVSIFSDLARFFEELHSFGIVHRDVKSKNILISTHLKRPSPIVIDWDLSVDFGYDGRSGSGYWLWPLCSQNGWALPVCDSFGLVMTMGGVLFCSDFTEMNNKHILFLGDNFRSSFDKTIVTHVKKRVSPFLNKSEVEAICLISYSKDPNLFFNQLNKWRTKDPKTIQQIINEVRFLIAIQELIWLFVKKDKELWDDIKNDPDWQMQLKDYRKYPAAIERLYTYIPSIHTLRKKIDQAQLILTAGIS